MEEKSSSPIPESLDREDCVEEVLNLMTSSSAERSRFVDNYSGSMLETYLFWFSLRQLQVTSDRLRHLSFELEWTWTFGSLSKRVKQWVFQYNRLNHSPSCLFLLRSTRSANSFLFIAINWSIASSICFSIIMKRESKRLRRFVRTRHVCRRKWRRARAAHCCPSPQWSHRLPLPPYPPSLNPLFHSSLSLKVSLMWLMCLLHTVPSSLLAS